MLWNAPQPNHCTTTRVAQVTSAHGAEQRRLTEFAAIMNDPCTQNIVQKTLTLPYPSFEHRVSPLNPFGLAADYLGEPEPGPEHPIVLHSSLGVAWIARDEVNAHSGWIDRWKVLIQATSGGDRWLPRLIWSDPGPFVSPPGEACTGSYLVAALCDSAAEARALVTYMRTRFFRFLVARRRVTQRNTPSVFRFVPDLPLDRFWSDAALESHFDLDPAEKATIERFVRGWPAPLR
ncbi:hypothetical protein [Leucobacter chinensis]|uniref:hypothetical protein n=1 Tax=Leucobacter chinensis TaxID=2851010 RepID=UPI001C24362C|nr:hypothetical protein [Leucobacter chinensis]